MALKDGGPPVRREVPHLGWRGLHMKVTLSGSAVVLLGLEATSCKRLQKALRFISGAHAQKLEQLRTLTRSRLTVFALAR
jgi:hypothetical protein